LPLLFPFLILIWLLVIGHQHVCTYWGYTCISEVA